MMGLMDRRRALMMAGEGESENHLLFSLYNYQFNNEYINTGVQAFGDKAVTILLDIDITSNPTSGDASTTKLISCVSTFVLGKRNASHAYYQIQTMGTWSGANTGITTTSTPGRKRFAVTHEAGSNNFFIKAQLDNNTPTQTTKSATFTATTSNLCFGAGGNTNYLATGTIKKAEVYDRVLSQSELDAFFA